MSSVSFNMNISANDQFKAQYTKYMRWALVSAVLFTILFFLFSPKVTITPYRLRDETMEVVDTMDKAIELPPPPEEAPKPIRDVVAVPDDEALDDEDIAETLLSNDEMLDIGNIFGNDNYGGFEVSQEKPKLTGFSNPDYPEMARASQLEGTVVVKVQVGTDGKVLQAIILKGVHPMLDNSALAAARRCKFSPGKQRGIAVKAWMAIPFAFRLHS